jgi:hypothetical protein
LQQPSASGPSHKNTLPELLLRRDLFVLAGGLKQSLKVEDVSNMVAHMLHFGDSPDATAVLARLVFAKTRGNPYFIINFLTKLYQTGLVVRTLPSTLQQCVYCQPDRLVMVFLCVGCVGEQWFDYEEGRWEWDLARIQAMGYTDNVVEFMAQGLRSLPQRTLALLNAAAFFGGRFDVHRDIAPYLGMSVVEAEDHLRPALHQGTLFLDLKRRLFAFIVPPGLIRGRPIA